MSNENNQTTNKYIPKHKQQQQKNKNDNKLDNDLIRISQAMDVMAKLIIEKRKQNELSKQTTNKIDNITEYDTKLKNLNDLINMILRLNNTSDNNNNIPNIVDTTKLDILLREKVDIIEKDGHSFALIPIQKDMPINNNNIIDPIKKKSKKKKKNKILCSFCNEPGHTRAHCEKKLYNIHQ